MLNCLRVTPFRSTGIIVRACSTGEKWDLLGAVCLERKPRIVPPMNELEQQFQKQLIEIELEKSFKSAHEVQHANDLKQIELMKKGETDLDVTLKQTAQDFVDQSMEELKKFKFASKVTEDDVKKNLKSTNRKLEKHLVLLTEQKIGGKSHFLPPQGLRQDGESLRQTAERVLREAVGKDVKAQLYSNAPAGFYKYKYPKPVRSQSGAVGAKVFIYFARHKNGELPKTLDYKWLDRQELEGELPNKYNQSLKMFLVDE